MDWRVQAKQRFDEIAASHAAGGHTVAPNGHCVTCSEAIRNALDEMYDEHMQDPEAPEKYWDRWRRILNRMPIRPQGYGW
jgi:hypothetical protein